MKLFFTSNFRHIRTQEILSVPIVSLFLRGEIAFELDLEKNDLDIKDIWKQDAGVSISSRKRRHVKLSIRRAGVLSHHQYLSMLKHRFHEEQEKCLERNISI